MYLYHNYNITNACMCVSVSEDISTCLNLHGCYALPNPVYFKKITFIIVIVKDHQILFYSKLYTRNSEYIMTMQNIM